MTDLLLAMRGIDKAFLGVPVLSGVDLTMAPGEVHALVGRTARASPRS
nr:hypothetical protein GCM10025732_15970 [Glycomyces mayteni]